MKTTSGRLHSGALWIALAVVPFCACVRVVPAAARAAPQDAAPEDGEGTKKKKEEPKPKPKPTVDAESVYYGRAKSFKTPAAISMDEVYAEIDEYQQVLEKKLECDECEYSILMNRAATRFRKAVRKAAKAGGYDLVAERGAVKDAGDVPDITSSVIAEL